MPATLRFTTGAWSGRDISLPEPEARIGRDPGVAVVIPPEDQRFVSRVHTAIIKEAGRYVAQDLESSNGTWVNGKRIQRIALADGDEIQFGRQGPVARFRCDVVRGETVAEIGYAARSVPRPGGSPRYVASGSGRSPDLVPPRPPVTREPPSQIVRRLVHEAMVTNVRRSRRHLAVVAVVIGLVGAGAAWAMASFGLFEGSEQTFRRLAEDYQGRVVLVEVGVSHDGRYSPLGNGSGFFASDGGLVVTNKHVVHTYLYDRDAACLAQSFRRRGFSFENALVITIWPGGSQFRQTPTSVSGDRGLGYSTEHQTLSLVVTAPDNLMPPVEISCRDAFGGPTFSYPWQRHAMDNNDLAVLRAAKSITPIPLARAEPGADDDVMVFGFPTGTIPLETNRAEPIRRVGRVLRTRETIQIDAVVLGGNSGGPLIDLNGNVVGITTRGTAESLNMAIKVEYARGLLDRARQTR